MKLERRVYETKQEKRKDLIIGIGIWFLLNVIFYGIVVAIQVVSSRSEDIGPIYPLISTALNFLPFLINIGLAIYFAFTRYWIALGMVIAYASIIVIGIFLGVILSIVCFFGLAAAGGL